MGLAGVSLYLNVIPNDEHIFSHINIRELDSYPDNLQLEDFVFKVVTSNYIYSITFGLTHIPFL
jgi:hypothetical protein